MMFSDFSWINGIDHGSFGIKAMGQQHQKQNMIYITYSHQLIH